MQLYDPKVNSRCALTGSNDQGCSVSGDINLGDYFNVQVLRISDHLSEGIGNGWVPQVAPIVIKTILGARGPWSRGL